MRKIPLFAIFAIGLIRFASCQRPAFAAPSSASSSTTSTKTSPSSSSDALRTDSTTATSLRTDSATDSAAVGDSATTTVDRIGTSTSPTATDGALATSSSSSQSGTSTSAATKTPQSVVSSHSRSDSGLSKGAQAGIGVGVAVGVVLLPVILFFSYKGRQRRKLGRGSDDAAAEKKTLSRKSSRRLFMLPTWKSELSAEPARAELDAGNSRDNQNTDNSSQARDPAELAAADEAPQELGETSIARHSDESSRGMSIHDVDGLTDQLDPPPVPYASKPRPS